MELWNEKEDGNIQITKKDFKQAYEVACDDVKAVLRAIYPAIEPPPEPKPGFFERRDGFQLIVVKINDEWFYRYFHWPFDLSWAKVTQEQLSSYIKLEQWKYLGESVNLKIVPKRECDAIKTKAVRSEASRN